MTLPEDHHATAFLQPDRDGASPGDESAPIALVLSVISAISGAIVGFLLAGNFYASLGLFAAALLSGWIGWWARGLYEGS